MTAEHHNLSRILALRDDLRRRDLHFVAITIARGGSRRYPRKNLVSVCGKPLVTWSVIQSLSSHLVTETYVSTDDEEIADVSRAAGARIIWRYESRDDVCGNVPFGHAIRQIREHHSVDFVLCKLPTNPVQHPWDFDEGFRIFWEARKTDRRAHELIQVVPNLETVLHERVSDNVSRPCLGNKSYAYMDAAGSAWNIADADWYLYYVATAPKTDKEIDVAFTDIYRQNEAFTGRDWLYYYQGEHYQRFDLDLPEQLGVIEDMMRRYILTTPDVYERYKAMGEALPLIGPVLEERVWPPEKMP